METDILKMTGSSENFVLKEHEYLSNLGGCEVISRELTEQYQNTCTKSILRRPTIICEVTYHKVSINSNVNVSRESFCDGFYELRCRYRKCYFQTFNSMIKFCNKNNLKIKKIDCTLGYTKSLGRF